MSYSDSIPTWQCSHFTSIMRCARCGLIFCGKCHKSMLHKSVAQRYELITACPDCGEQALIDLNQRHHPEWAPEANYARDPLHGKAFSVV